MLKQKLTSVYSERIIFFNKSEQLLLVIHYPKVLIYEKTKYCITLTTAEIVNIR